MTELLKRISRDGSKLELEGRPVPARAVVSPVDFWDAVRSSGIRVELSDGAETFKTIFSFGQVVIISDPDCPQGDYTFLLPEREMLARIRELEDSVRTVLADSDRLVTAINAMPEWERGVKAAVESEQATLRAALREACDLAAHSPNWQRVAELKKLAEEER